MNESFRITREKHLDHMVKVVPVIVLGYALQCYMIMKLGPGNFAQNSLLFLGLCLVAMIAGFITYDLKHKVEFKDRELVFYFAPFHNHITLSYHEIVSVELSEAGQSFATLTLLTSSGKKYRFYFVDEADKIKSWLDDKKSPSSQLAA